MEALNSISRNFTEDNIYCRNFRRLINSSFISAMKAKHQHRYQKENRASDKLQLLGNPVGLEKVLLEEVHMQAKELLGFLLSWQITDFDASLIGTETLGLANWQFRGSELSILETIIEKL